MAKAPAGALVAILYFGCGGDSTDGKLASNEVDETSEDDGSDHNDVPDLPDGTDDIPDDDIPDDDIPNDDDAPDDSGNEDFFLAQLDHSSIETVRGGFVIWGYDADDNVIGRIAVNRLGSNRFQIIHKYSRPCTDAAPDPAEDDCFDILRVVARVHDGVVESTIDAWQPAAPSGLFTVHAYAMMAKLPPDTVETQMSCALNVAAAVAACVTIEAFGPLAAPGCALGTKNLLCMCGEAFEWGFPKTDSDDICG